MANTSVLTTPWIPSPSDGIDSETLTTQLETEQIISDTLTAHISTFAPPLLNKSQHLTFLTRFLTQPLSSGYTGLDASRPWILYWTLHSLSLFEGELDQPGKQRVVETLRACQNPDGGFGGGPGQMSHLAPSYAAVSALAYVGEEAWGMIDRRGMYNFLLSVKQPDGSFIMHIGGDLDVRGCYCALTIATLLNLLTPTLALNTPSHIASCQTYEGGLASTSYPFPDSRIASPLGEAHGGYAFCAVASWSLLRAFSSPLSPSFVPPPPATRTALDLRSLLRWATSVQANPIEGGGFKGRTNKLVDGCYSWWAGGIFGVLGGLLGEEEGEAMGRVDLWDRSALQEYVLLLAQAPGGGLRDKPGKAPDAYHTCYNLSGLSSSQHRMVSTFSRLAELREQFVSPFGARVVEEGEEVERVLGEGESEESAERRMREVWSCVMAWEVLGKKLLVGGEENEVMPTHPVLNLTMKHAHAMMRHFYEQPVAVEA